MPYICRKCQNPVTAGPTRKPGQPQVGHCDCPDSAWIVAGGNVRKVTAKGAIVDESPHDPSERGKVVFETDDAAADWKDP